MKNKLRILIFDHRHFNCLYLEKIFNFLGYHRIAPVSRYEELVSIIEHSVMPIDLVCYNFLDFKKHDDADFFLRNYTHIKYLMPYNELDISSKVRKHQRSEDSETTHCFLPDLFSVGNQMKSIESIILNKCK